MLLVWRIDWPLAPSLLLLLTPPPTQQRHSQQPFVGSAAAAYHKLVPYGIYQLYMWSSASAAQQQAQASQRASPPLPRHGSCGCIIYSYIIIIYYLFVVRLGLLYSTADTGDNPTGIIKYVQNIAFSTIGTCIEALAEWWC